MKKINAKIIADSKNTQGDRVTTMLLTYPRFIHGELLTHRMFSKNSASSRAIPFEKMVRMVQEDPFIPIAWQKEHTGMQGSEYFQPHETFISENPMDKFAKGISSEDSTAKVIVDRLKAEWLWGADMAIQTAKNLHNMGVLYHPNGDITKLTGDDRGLTKQLCNRLLEPYMWHTVLLTATEFENFFELRCPKYKLFGLTENYVRSKKEWLEKMQFSSALHPSQYPQTIEDWLKIDYSQAEIHMQALAEAMWDAMNESTPKELKSGEWHIPFGDRLTSFDFGDRQIKENLLNLKIKISTARCARLSYMTFDGKIDYEKDIKLHDTLLESQHMSPFEHCCRAMTSKEYDSFIKGELYLERINDNFQHYKLFRNNKKVLGWCNNFKGFIQYRYLIENEK